MLTGIHWLVPARGHNRWHGTLHGAHSLQCHSFASHTGVYILHLAHWHTQLALYMGIQLLALHSGTRSLALYTVVHLHTSVTCIYTVSASLTGIYCPHSQPASAHFNTPHNTPLHTCMHISCITYILAHRQHCKLGCPIQ